MVKRSPFLLYTHIRNHHAREYKKECKETVVVDSKTTLQTEKENNG